MMSGYKNVYIIRHRNKDLIETLEELGLYNHCDLFDYEKTYLAATDNYFFNIHPSILSNDSEVLIDCGDDEMDFIRKVIDEIIH